MKMVFQLKKLKAFIEGEHALRINNQINRQTKPKARLKPYNACVLESLMPHILSSLRKAFLGCKEIMLYQTQGIAVASTEIHHPISLQASRI